MLFVTTKALQMSASHRWRCSVTFDSPVQEDQELLCSSKPEEADGQMVAERSSM